MYRFLAALACAVAFCAPAQPPAKPARVALVIGNAAYAAAPLGNPLNDAADIAKELESAGFTVIRRDNATLREMHLALREFGDRLGRTSTGLFYFAGHGVQVRGRNYLLPVDADIAREDEAAFAAMDLAAVMEKLDSARNPVNIVILDACRDNPFGNKLQPSAKGLAQVEAPPGTLIAFSTAPGNAAADGGGRNGLYTGHLLVHMKKPGAPIEETLRAVRAAVRRDSRGLQVPWESTSLETEFAFRAAPAKVAVAPPSAAANPGRPRGAGAVSPFAPPTFVAGDTWTYRYSNLLAQTQKQTVMTVKEIQGAQVYWDDGSVGDLLGNMTRVKRNGEWRLYSPSSQMYVFPLNPGSSFTLKSVENGARTFDLHVTMAIGGEEEIATPAGRFRAVKIVRTVKWARRGNASDTGVNTWTYWYSGPAKRWVVAEQSNVTTGGKQLQLDRWELESYRVR